MMMGIKKWKEEVESFQTTPNIAFLRTIIHHIDQFFSPGEVDDIWIVHPDPRPK
jgi:tRNA (guanine-N7-)-methyltransferase